jgi:ADP-heptose:LPS heptosyltransferase
MRLMDRFIGIPLCWSLGLYYRLFGNSGNSQLRQPVKSILVIKFFGMGSILLATPAISLIRRAFPEARISFLSFRNNKELLERISTIDEVLTVNRSSFVSFMKETLLVAHSIRLNHYDIVFDFEFFSKYSTLLNGLSRAHIRIGFDLPTMWRASILTHQVPLEKNQHVVHSFCAQIKSVATKADHTPDVEAPRICDSDHASLLRKFPIDRKRIITINVNAGDTFLERRWPGERFGQLVAKLAQDDESLFCFIGNSEERTYVRQVMGQTQNVDRCVDTAGQLTIPELGALLQRSDILISNDSGPLHLAASLGIPTLGLYGPESPEFYGARSADSAILYKGIPCSPCMNIYSAKQFQCPYHARCMREISVDEVYECAHSTMLIGP